MIPNRNFLGSNLPKLFGSKELRAYLDVREAALKREVSALPDAQRAQVDEGAWADALAEKYAIVAPEVDPDGTRVVVGDEEDLPIAFFPGSFFPDPYGPQTVRGRYLHHGCRNRNHRFSVKRGSPVAKSRPEPA